MPRSIRVDQKGYTYHVLNRANTRVQIFNNRKDYEMFEKIIEEAKERFDISIYAYCIMPNHWHLVLSIKEDGDLQKSLAWITGTHTRRWHVDRGTIGHGHLYQGRYKSFICQNDDHFLILARYVERNPKKAKLVKKAEDWRWGSLWRTKHGSLRQKKLLSNWLVSKPKDYFSWVNSSQAEEEEDFLKVSIKRGSPFGKDNWIGRIIKKFNLESTIRPRGRPRKK